MSVFCTCLRSTNTSRNPAFDKKLSPKALAPEGSWSPRLHEPAVFLDQPQRTPLCLPPEISSTNPLPPHWMGGG